MWIDSKINVAISIRVIDNQSRLPLEIWQCDPFDVATNTDSPYKFSVSTECLQQHKLVSKRATDHADIDNISLSRRRTNFVGSSFELIGGYRSK